MSEVLSIVKPPEASSDFLGNHRADYVASAAKAILGAAPFVGSLLVEIAGHVIPNQRIDRISRFALELEKRLAGLEQDHIRAKLADENFTDLVEEGLRQAARSTTDERRQHIASVIANSLSPDEISFTESKHLLRILGEMNDAEAIWLRFYLVPTLTGDEEFRSKHEELLSPAAAHLRSPQSDIDKETLSGSYKEHLMRLGLLQEKIRANAGKAELDNRTGLPRRQGFELTPLGMLLLRQMGFERFPQQ